MKTSRAWRATVWLFSLWAILLILFMLSLKAFGQVAQRDVLSCYVTLSDGMIVEVTPASECMRSEEITVRVVNNVTAEKAPSGPYFYAECSNGVCAPKRTPHVKPKSNVICMHPDGCKAK